MNSDPIQDELNRVLAKFAELYHQARDDGRVVPICLCISFDDDGFIRRFFYYPATGRCDSYSETKLLPTTSTPL